MNRRILSFSLAAACVAGIAVAVVPQHAWSIARVAAATVTTLAGATVLVAVGTFTRHDPEHGALDRPSTGEVPPLDPHGLRDARRDLDHPTAPGSVPPVVRERLQAAAMLRLQAAGVDVGSGRSRDEARHLVSPGTWSLLSRPPTPGDRRDAGNVAAIVNHTLDDLDAILQPSGATR